MKKVFTTKEKIAYYKDRVEHSLKRLAELEAVVKEIEPLGLTEEQLEQIEKILFKIEAR